mgnify:CR=1 FL=1
MIRKKENLLDITLLLPILIITSISLVFIYSSSNVIAYADYGNPFFFLQRQIVALSISLIACAVFLFIPISFYRQNGLILLLLSSILLALVLVPGIGIERNGATRWLSIGPINIQPSEIMKLGLILMLAKYFDHISKIQLEKLIPYLLPLLMIILPGILVISQPDLGTSILIASSGLITVSYTHLRAHET